VTKNALLDQVWGHRFVTESVLKTAISEVRAALDDDPKAAALHRDRIAAWLSLHRCHGWRFVATRACH
jgi:DNA-binding winged-HTH domains